MYSNKIRTHVSSAHKVSKQSLKAWYNLRLLKLDFYSLSEVEKVRFQLKPNASFETRGPISPCRWKLPLSFVRDWALHKLGQDSFTRAYFNLFSKPLASGLFIACINFVPRLWSWAQAYSNSSQNYLGKILALAM